MKRLIYTALTLAVLAGISAAVYRSVGAETPANRFKTATVAYGDILETVSATGTLEPEEVVDVGAQVLGRVKELGLDPRGKSDEKFANKHVDYCSPVEEGMILAQIDPAIYEATFRQAEAALAQANANVVQMEAKLMQADAEYQRAQRLRALNLEGSSPTGSRTGRALPVKGISDADFVLAQANFESARANVGVAKATVSQQEATLLLAKTNLDYTTIRSPVSGTVIARRVNVGQTVVSAMSAPSLFLIARDLRRMQIWANVNEADIGRLKVDMPVHFGVDAFPNDVFYGRVEQIRLNASMTSNVVVFTVVIAVDNSDLKLLPYLTANVEFEVESRPDVLVVPNAALRFQPQPDQIALTAAGKTEEPSEGSRTVWLVDNASSLLRPVQVQTGLTDGSFTEVTGGDLAVDDQVVVREVKSEVQAEVNNPFAPPRFRGRKPEAKK